MTYNANNDIIKLIIAIINLLSQKIRGNQTSKFIGGMIMFRLKKMITILLIFLLAISNNHLIFADTFEFETENKIAEEQHAKLEELVGELSSLTAQKILKEVQQENSRNLSDISELDDKIENIESEIKMLDNVEVLTDDEATEFIINSGNDESDKKSRITKPGNSNTVKWLLSTYSYTRSGTKYEVQELLAVGNNPGGMLVTGKDNEMFFSNKQLLANGAKELVSMYVQKAIGLIPVVAWTPYELLFSSSSQNVFNTNYITHRAVSTLSFIYVKKSGQSDAYQTLRLYSNRIDVAFNTHGAAVVNSKPFTYNKNGNFAQSSTSYGSISAAVDAYLSSRTIYDYIPSYKMNSYDKTWSKTAYVPNPLAGPGQVY